MVNISFITRIREQLFEVNGQAGDAGHGRAGLGGFDIGRGDATKMLGLIDETFGDLAFLEMLEIGGAGLGAPRGTPGDDAAGIRMHSEGRTPNYESW